MRDQGAQLTRQRMKSKSIKKPLDFRSFLSSLGVLERLPGHVAVSQPRKPRQAVGVRRPHKDEWSLNRNEENRPAEKGEERGSRCHGFYDRRR